MRDFTFEIYKKFLNELMESGYEFLNFYEFIQNQVNKQKTVIMRHDVDRLPENALKMAQIEKEFGIKSTYFFRTIKSVFKPDIIGEIAEMGHEIGYHYENLAKVGQRLEARGQRESHHHSPLTNHQDIFLKAIEDFEENLRKFREIVPIKTICMHGSPMSKYDSRDLWKKYDYRDYGIIGEPYFDIDYNEVLYLTDTGRRWDGSFFNVRDKVIDEGQVARGQNVEDRRKNKEEKNKISKTNNHLQHSFHSTFDIIKAAEEGRLPDKMMINIHPQRWNDRCIPWFWELVSQNVKNVVKKYFFVKKKESRR